LRLGFDKTALLYSESETQKKSGLIGWIDENQLSKKFKNELKLLDEGQITNPINVSSGKIILKINKIKIGSSTINTEKELEKIILQEKDRQLNNFSIIHYNKIKNKLLNKDE
jgi:parvulin-like peptidyl-prolyl isomerase